MESITNLPFGKRFQVLTLHQPVWQRIILLAILGYEALGALFGSVLLIAASVSTFVFSWAWQCL